MVEEMGKASDDVTREAYGKAGENGVPFELPFPYMDAHCDTLTCCADRQASLSLNQGQVDVARLWQAGCALQTFAVWLDPVYYDRPLRQVLLYLEYFEEQRRESLGMLAPVLCREDLFQNLQAGKISALLTIEGGEVLEGELPLLHTLFRLGVRGMNLVWNHPNALGHPAVEPGDEGLTAFGRDVVREMERLHMIPDVSHLNRAGFWDVAALCQGPFMASHSNAQALCPHPRNLTDDQLLCLIDRQGFVGLNFCPSFLREEGAAKVEDVLRHGERILRLGGENVLGLGSDFDGIETTPEGLEGTQALPGFWERLTREWGRELAEKVAYRNFLDFLSRTLPQ